MKPARDSLIKKIGTGFAYVGLWELAWWARRRLLRGNVYECASRDAVAAGRSLVVVGAPDRGATGGYGCGDVTVDIASSACPVTLRADITKKLPFEDDSVTVFVSCVLEYVDDAEVAYNELRRVAGEHLFLVRVEPWTLAAYLYPGAKRTLPAYWAAGCEKLVEQA